MIKRIAAILRGPGASCFMNEKDSLDTAKEIFEALSDPTPAMIEAMVRMHRTARSGSDETLVHDVWQSGCDAALAE